MHSFWSKPSLVGVSSLEKVHGGWPHPKYHYMGWALSCLTFKKHYNDVQLVTDSKGKEMLIDTFNLPYTSVAVELNKINHYPEKLWALGKLYAYKIQDTPFIHVDGDIFIWKRFNSSLEKSELIGQHLDNEENHYHTSMHHLEKNNISIPQELKDDFAILKRFNSTNAGILGGKNIDFFQEYVDRAFHFVDKNLEKVNNKINGSSFAIIYEQYMFSALARKWDIEINHLIQYNDTGIMHLSDFFNRYLSKKYVHLLAKTKSSLECYHEMEMQLLTEHPDYHERICSFFD
ncbi:DUF6734 family protein [Flagellimonas meridianipacifica]|uniref:DUF6734 family protein n=1 Tax=Flagellimonas meridianipacifica TaxID=1080225 RepID=UPI0028BDD1B4|nr:DUF6734 family protein [Allomuricauda pacifica]